MKVRQPSNALALAVGALALAVATTSTAVAAAGQLVTVTDPVNAANKARVTGKGQLKVDPAPANPARGTAAIRVNEFNVVIPHTTSTVALTDLTWSAGNHPYSVWLYQANVPAGSDCSSTGNWTAYRYLGERTLESAATLVEDRTTPLVLAPFSAGAPWCFVVAGASVSGLRVEMLWSGNVLAGALPTTGPASSAPRVAKGRPVPSREPSLMVTPTG